MKGETRFIIHKAKNVTLIINNPAIFYPEEIIIPIEILNNSTLPVTYQIDKELLSFSSFNVTCKIDCITSFSYAQWEPDKDPSSVGHNTRRFKTHPPTIKDLNFTIGPNRQASIGISVLLPDELTPSRKNLKQVENSLKNDSLLVTSGHILIGDELFIIEEFYLITDKRIGK